MKLLYYSPASYGGIADYAHEQANALVEAGAEVSFLTTPNYPRGRNELYKILPILRDIKPEQPILNKVSKSIHYISVTFKNNQKLVQVIKSQSFQNVLFGSYSEYLAPIWAGSLRKLVQQGIVFGAVVHDPVRDFIVGPYWWHRWSIASGYSFVREVFVHESIELDTVQPMPNLKVSKIPFGTYHFSEATQTRELIREKLQLPDTAKVILAFGHIRDGKNLDMLIRAMVDFPEVYLIVAGKEQSSGQRSVTFYQNLARDLNVFNRCKWIVRFIPETEVANLFEASDISALTYSSNFRSASSALSVSTNYRKICLASAGEGALKSNVQNYNLGVWVEPDDLSSLSKGLKRCISCPPKPDWEKYFAENSWLLNAQIVLDNLTTNSTENKGLQCI